MAISSKLEYGQWGTGDHVGVVFTTMKGEFDDQLKWPVKCTITLQLLNQTRDRDHVTVTKEIQWDKPPGYQSYAISLNFIAHDDLRYNPQKQTQYLRDDDCLIFRIAKMKLEPR